MRTRVAILITFCLFAFCPALSGSQAAAAQAMSQNEKATITFFEAVRNNTALLRAFIKSMPKGADLRVELTSSVYAETLLAWAAEDGLCLGTNNAFTSPENGKCPSSDKPVRNILTDDKQFSAAVNALSTRADYSAQTIPSLAHTMRKADMQHLSQKLGAIAKRHLDQNVSYVEVVVTPFPPDVAKLAAKAGWNGDALGTWNTLDKLGLFESVATTLDTIAQADAAATADISHPTAASADGFRFRYLIGADRNASPALTFAQLAYGMEMAKRDARIAGVTLTGAENTPAALMNHGLHMAMVSGLSAHVPYADTQLAIPAGRLALGQVPPAALENHVTLAAETGGADRLEHATAILNEQTPFALLDTLSQSGTAVNACLTGDKKELGISGKQHPFTALRGYGVPVTLSTGMAGILRTTLTDEYTRAAVEYNLTYGDLKALARNSLEYSFLEGESLWKDPATFRMNNACKDSLIEHETATCAALLSESEKASAQWNLERRFADFERQMAGQIPRQ